MLTRNLIVVLGLAAGALALEAQTPTAPPPATQPPATQAASPKSSNPPAAAAPSAVDGGEPKWIHPETPAQRKLRLGTEEDPGLDPDLTKHYWRYGHMYTIRKAERRWANFDNPPEEGYVRPFGFVNIYRELYQMNDKWVWTWEPDKDPIVPDQPQQEASPFSREQLDYLQDVRSDFTPLGVPSADTTIHFEEASQGLPSAGSWRNSLAVADMNEDGCPDLIAPPERGIPNGVPAIFLGDCKGHWTFWKEARWPHALDYGSVAAADFNKDGHMDLVFGVHLTGIFVFTGDGKGSFTDSSADLPTDFPTRRVIVADVDHDGYPDVVALSEGPTPRDSLGSNPKYNKLRAYLNRDKGKHWEGENISAPNEFFGGDWLSTGKFNDDNYPDFVGASIYFNGPDVIHMSTGPKKYASTSGHGKATLYYSYYYANTVGHFTSKKLDDAIVSFVRNWPDTVPTKLIPTPPATNISGLDRISFSGKEPVRTPIVRWAGGHGVWGLAAGDFDGDGNLDLIYSHADPRGIDILLGDGKGGFRRATIEGLRLEGNTNYDIKVADVNGDGKPDVILAYESSGSTMLSARDGSIHVYLNRGTAPATKAAPKP